MEKPRDTKTLTEIHILSPPPKWGESVKLLFSVYFFDAYSKTHRKWYNKTVLLPGVFQEGGFWYWCEYVEQVQNFLKQCVFKGKHESYNATEIGLRW